MFLNIYPFYPRKNKSIIIIVIIIIVVIIIIAIIIVTIISAVNKNQIYSTYPMFIFVKLAFGGQCLHFQVHTINSMI